MISHRHRFLFVHVPKTGGNSVQNILAPFSEDEIVVRAAHQDGVERFEVAGKGALTKHATMDEYRRIYGWRLWRYFKFATMRNPFEKAVSLYFSPHAGRTAFDAEEFARVITEMPTLRHYTGNPRRVCLMRFERLAEDFAQIANRLGLGGEPLPVRNKSARPDHRECYDSRTRALIEEHHAEEIALGGYRF